MSLFRIAPHGYEAAKPDGRLILVLAHRSEDIPELPAGATFAVESERGLAPHFTLPRDWDALRGRLLEWGSIEFARRYTVSVVEQMTHTLDIMAISREAAHEFAIASVNSGDKRARVKIERNVTAEVSRHPG